MEQSFIEYIVNELKKSNMIKCSDRVSILETENEKIIVIKK